MRTTNVSRSTIKNPAAYVYPRVEVNNVDLTSRVNHIQLECSSESGGWTAEVQFVNHPDLEDLTPWGSGMGGVLKPLNPIKIWLRATPTKGQYSGSEDLVFEGTLGDEIVVSKNVSGDDTVVIRCRSKWKRKLQDIYVLDDRVYPVGARGTNPWEVGNENYTEYATAVAQQIIDEHVPSPRPTLRVLHDPEYVIYPYTVAEEDVWTLLQNLLLATGYVLAERFWPATSSFELVLFDPLIVGGMDTLEEGNYRLVSQNFSDADRRTLVRVYYRSRDPEGDKAQGAIEPPYAPEGILYVQKSVSAPYPRAMKVVEDETSLIDTYGEASAFAQMILDELQHHVAKVSLDVPGAFYYLEPYDKLGVSGPVEGELTVTDLTIVVGRQRGSIVQYTQVQGIMEMD